MRLAFMCTKEPCNRLIVSECVCALVSCVQNVLCEAENPINADLLRNSKTLLSRIRTVTMGHIFHIAVSGSMYICRWCVQQIETCKRKSVRAVYSQYDKMIRCLPFSCISFFSLFLVRLLFTYSCIMFRSCSVHANRANFDDVVQIHLLYHFVYV